MDAVKETGRETHSSLLKPSENELVILPESSKWVLHKFSVQVEFRELINKLPFSTQN